MKRFFISFGVFTLIIGVDSLIPVEETMPYGNTFPALILKTSLISGIKPALPHEIRTENDGSKAIKMLMFESLDKKFKFLNNLSLSYKCPEEKNSKILVENENENENKRCKDELQVSVLPSGSQCGNFDRKEYDIGYGIKTEGSTFYFRRTQPGNKVEHWLYTSCFDNVENRVYAVRYEMRQRNDLYQITNKIYPPAVQDIILQRHLNFVEKMAQNIKPLEKKGSKVIPFQLISHEDMILYNWKLATFNEKNYSFIWSNVAENSWKTTNNYLRRFMAESNFDLEVFSGVHDYTDGGYPRYIWKYIRNGTQGMAVVIHNQHVDDEENYPELCEEPNNNCDQYGVFRNEKDKNKGYLYCCPTDDLHEILFFKNKFSNFEKLEFKELCSVDQEYHSPAYDLVSSGSVRSSRPSSPTSQSPPPTSNSSSPSSDRPPSSSTSYVDKAGPYDKSIHKPRVPVSTPYSTRIPKYNQPTEDVEVAKLRSSFSN